MNDVTTLDALALKIDVLLLLGGVSVILLALLLVIVIDRELDRVRPPARKRLRVPAHDKTLRD